MAERKTVSRAVKNPVKRKLTRAEKKEIAAVIQAAKGDGKPHTAQQTIPYLQMYPDGICRVTEKKYSKEEQKFLLKCREVIDNNLNNSSFEIMAFAEHMGMSHSTLYRKIKGMTGMTVVEFINEYRLFKAVQYFKEGETNIGTVCAKCGFNDVKHFRDLFKRKMNMTPKQYVLSL